MTTRVDLTVIDLDAPPDAADWSRLAPDERQRAERYRFDVHRRRFVRGRSVLRESLAQRCGIDADAVRFAYGPNGKPSLPGGPGFNLSHCEGLGLLGVESARTGVAIGVDIELLRPGFADDELAHQCFAPSEYRQWRAVASEEREAAFFRCWTRKESYLKAHGGGLQVPLDSFTVEFVDPRAAALTWVLESASEPERWTVLDVSEAVSEVAGVVAVAAISVAGPATSGALTRR